MDPITTSIIACALYDGGKKCVVSTAAAIKKRLGEALQSRVDDVTAQRIANFFRDHPQYQQADSAAALAAALEGVEGWAAIMASFKQIAAPEVVQQGLRDNYYAEGNINITGGDINIGAPAPPAAKKS